MRGSEVLSKKMIQEREFAKYTVSCYSPFQIYRFFPGPFCVGTTALNCAGKENKSMCGTIASLKDKLGRSETANQRETMAIRRLEQALTTTFKTPGLLAEVIYTYIVVPGLHALR